VASGVYLLRSNVEARAHHLKLAVLP
jgi:hypothetical protein